MPHTNQIIGARQGIQAGDRFTSEGWCYAIPIAKEDEMTVTPITTTTEPRTHRPSCPSCSTTMRRDQETGDWRCDLHGLRVPIWMPVTEPEEEDAA